VPRIARIARSAGLKQPRAHLPRHHERPASVHSIPSPFAPTSIEAGASCLRLGIAKASGPYFFAPHRHFWAKTSSLQRWFSAAPSRSRGNAPTFCWTESATLSNTHGPSGSNISGGSTGKISQTVTSVRELDVLHRLKKRLRLDLDDLDQQPSGARWQARRSPINGLGLLLARSP